MLRAEGDVRKLYRFRAEGFTEVEGVGRAAREVEGVGEVLVDDGARRTGVDHEMQGGKIGDMAFDNDEVAVKEGHGDGVGGSI